MKGYHFYLFILLRYDESDWCSIFVVRLLIRKSKSFYFFDCWEKITNYIPSSTTCFNTDYWRCLVLTFDVVLEDRSVVVLPPVDLESGAGVGLPALVPGDHLDLASVPVLTLGDVQVPHTVVDQLVTAPLNMKNIKRHVCLHEAITLMTVCPLMSHITLGLG